MQTKSPAKYQIAAVVALLLFAYHFVWFIYFAFFKYGLFEFHYQLLPRINNVLSGLCSLAGLLACVAFLSGNKKAVKWIRFFSLIKLFLATISFVTFFISFGYQFTVPWYNYLIVGGQIVLLGYAVLVLNEISTSEFEQVTIAGEVLQYQAEMARGGTRFLNRLIDYVIIIHVLMLHGLFKATADGSSISYILIIVASFIYYLLLEAIFKTTPAKIITGCSIINEDGSKPAFLKMLGRTFCRYIPFDAFSFLGSSARGWHDSLPNVYVVKENTKRFDIANDTAENF